MGTLLHHLPELASDGQFAPSGNDRHFNSKQFTTELRPGKTCCDTDLRLGFSNPIPELRRTKVLTEARGRDSNVGIAIALDHFDRYLATDRGDFALDIANACLPRIVADDGEDRLVGELDVLLFQSISLALLAD